MSTTKALPRQCARSTCLNTVPPQRLALAERTKAKVAYCSASCRAVSQQRRYRDRKRAAAAAAA